MIKYVKGNLLDAKVDALVNTVNEVGVMGKGIALIFKESFPDNTKAYEAACKNGEVNVGSMFVTRNPAELIGPRWIVNFPTKKHWRHPSKLVWIRDGLRDLVRVIQEYDIKSIALPPLGCGNGGLDWLQVKNEIEYALISIPELTVLVYEPTNVYHNAPKRVGVEALTPARALIAELVRQYAILGIDCTNLEVQKLAWFLHRMIVCLKMHDPLKLNFKPHKYGPYADNLRHLLDGLDGSYLSCEKRLSDAGPLDRIAFNWEKTDIVQSYLQESAQPFLPAMERTASLIDGFESPLGMELLATVDWLLIEQRCTNDRASIKEGLANWPGGKSAGKRKLKLFSDRLIDLALERLI